MKLYEEFSKDDTKVEWDTMLKVGEIFNDMITKDPVLKFLYLATDEHYEKDWEMMDNDTNFKSLDFEFEFFFHSFIVDNVYLSNIDEKMKTLNDVVNSLKKLFGSFNVKIYDKPGNESGVTMVSVQVTHENLKKDPKILNIFKSASGMNKYNL